MAVHGKTDRNEERAVKVQEDGSVVVVTDGQPLAVSTKRDLPLRVQDNGLLADGDVSQTASISSTAATYTLQEEGGLYLVLAVDNACFLRWDGGTCTTSAGGFSIVAPEGVPLTLRIPGKSVSHIGSTTAGTITFLHLKRV